MGEVASEVGLPGSALLAWNAIAGRRHPHRPAGCAQDRPGQHQPAIDHQRDAGDKQHDAVSSVWGVPGGARGKADG